LGKAKYELKDVICAAKKDNIKCLSTEYNYSSMDFICETCGHQWTTRSYRILNGFGCPKCNHEKARIDRVRNKYTLADIQKIAEERNGKCLSEKYSSLGMKFSCNICGYVWKTKPCNVVNGSWCEKCYRENWKVGLENAQKLAKQNNGELLSNEYKIFPNKLKWRCSEGHVFEMCYNSVKKGHWCPVCAGNASKNMEDLDSLAKENNGVCLSKKYIHSREKLKWKCSKGHIFEASYNKVQQGQWCPYCAYGKSENKFREIIEDILDAEFPRKYPPWLINPETGHKLQLDGYNKELGIAFEYQGHQHFKRAYYDKSDNALKERQARDKIKKELCKKQGITLLCPTYKMDESEYEQYIQKFMDF
jgi:thiol-disulfide isomerase/thioredoxin